MWLASVPVFSFYVCNPPETNYGHGIGLIVSYISIRIQLVIYQYEQPLRYVTDKQVLY